MQLFTIGHSNLSIDAFTVLLKQHSIRAVADVRSHPYSRYLPHFNQESLKKSLIDAGISYVFLGNELGARPKDLSCYIEGKALYEKIAATDLFAEGIKRILQGLKSYNIALMCAEKDPITCHRTIFICQHLSNYNLNIQHILNNGDLESHQHLEERLLVLQNLKRLQSPNLIQLSLFSESLASDKLLNSLPKKEALKKAYKLQSEQIAYVEKKDIFHESKN